MLMAMPALVALVLRNMQVAGRGLMQAKTDSVPKLNLAAQVYNKTDVRQEYIHSPSPAAALYPRQSNVRLLTAKATWKHATKGHRTTEMPI